MCHATTVTYIKQDGVKIPDELEDLEKKGNHATFLNSIYQIEITTLEITKQDSYSRALAAENILPQGL
jgi:hypothetical protein